VTETLNGVFDEAHKHYDEQPLALLIMHIAMIKNLEPRECHHQAGGR
jgi:hypothetical protein